METQKIEKWGKGWNRTTHGPVLCCASTATVNETGEKVICKYGNVEIGTPAFMEDIAAILDAGKIRKE